MSEDLLTFFGRFHPFWVHLPIGFLVLAVQMWVYADWKKNERFFEAISFSLLLGTGSALVAVILGFLLSRSGGYEGNLLDIHQVGGWTTVACSGLAWWMSLPKQKFSRKLQYWVLGLLLVVLSVTGHFGGSLTHGVDYLTAYAPF